MPHHTQTNEKSFKVWRCRLAPTPREENVNNFAVNTSPIATPTPTRDFGGSFNVSESREVFVLFARGRTGSLIDRPPWAQWYSERRESRRRGRSHCRPPACLGCPFSHLQSKWNERRHCIVRITSSSEWCASLNRPFCREGAASLSILKFIT